MSVLTSRPVLRWAVPAGVVLVVLGGGALTTALRASADVRLPPRSAAQLLVDLQTARLDGVSGTVVERADLGLPMLPAGLGNNADGLDPTSLITGSNTLRVWYSGQDKARVALLRAMGESDVIHNGADTWVWNSKDNAAVHYHGDATGAHEAPPVTKDLPQTPQDVANQVLAALDPTTKVSTDSNDIVAGRKAYQLVLQPRDKTSLVAEVRFAIDGTAHVPTRAEVFAKGDLDRSVFEIGFTQVSFTRPDNAVFTFNPPPGVKVTEADADKAGADKAGADKPDASGAHPVKPAPPGAQAQPRTAVIGKGWTAVLVTRMPETKDSAPKNNPNDRTQAGLQSFFDRLPQVHGAFGTGRVLGSKLFTVLLLDDGRVLVGAVDQNRLIQAASDPAAALK